MTARLTVDPIRGYDKPFKRLVTFIEGGLELERAGLGILDEALEALGRTSRDYSSKLSLSLNPRERSDVALKSILAILFDTMLRNEKGTKDDTDSEFLHDFRVAVRRTRSALALIRKVFPDETVSFFKKEFSWLGGVTGPTRDLDVYLLKMPTYQRLLSDRVSADLKPLHSFLTQLQVEEQRRLRRVLESERYRQIVRGWSAFLTAAAVESPGCRDASRPISEVARGRIWKTYRKVLRDGSAISSRSPAEKLHRLRIDCKKLRYLLEFFGSLFERQTVRVLIRALKRLQDHLGDFNDYEVQQSKMEEFSDEMMSRGPVAPRTLLAMGRLVEKLEEGQEIERRRFHGRFARFSSPDNQKDFGRLFAPTSQDV